MPPEISPRIYCINPRLVGAEDWPRLLDHCVALGFDHILIVRETMGASDLILEPLLIECAERDVRVLLDLTLAGVSSRDPLLQQHPQWFDPPQCDDDAALDPRHYGVQRSSARMRWEDPAVMEAGLAWWRQHLIDLIDLGVAGLVICAPGPVPCTVWRRLSAPLRERHACCHLLAWTPGCSSQQLSALSDCGFDAVFSSGAWWDFRADWWVQEQARLRVIAPPIAFPEDPFGPRLARLWHLDDAESAQRAAVRALRFAAASGNGWLMPMGFEYGLTEPLFGGFADAQAYQQACAQSAFNLSGSLGPIVQANRFVAEIGSRYYGARLRMLSAPHAPTAEIERRLLSDDTLPPLLISVNSDLYQAQTQTPALQRSAANIERMETAASADMPEETIAPGALLIRYLPPPAPVITVTTRSRRAALVATCAPRIAIEAVTPAVDNGRFPVKRMIGENLTIEADILLDGHDHLAAQVLWQTADSRKWQSVPMRDIGNDRWQAQLPLQRMGRYLFSIEAWRDVFASYRDDLDKKSRAGLDLTLELEEGRLLVLQAAAATETSGKESRALKLIAKELTASETGDADSDSDQKVLHDAARTSLLLADETDILMQRNLPRQFVTRSEITYPVDAERMAAQFAAWYELFPRSQSGEEHRHGTFFDVIERLPAIAAMGFDTLYFTPIHPIGRRNRKGRNNSLTPDANDPGSPYAIGSDEGGHDAIHPALGSLEDFRALRAAAASHGLELALDFAIQCAPDHPWLSAHPDWFAWRADGSMRYAENPPKK
ncbi:MAG TPA: maltotransferase domain-containing protein, partial [Herbaspirillum sp.]|nr:maltotransferase domain-containing protein [Herbaspirillum sp.]